MRSPLSGSYQLACIMLTSLVVGGCSVLVKDQPAPIETARVLHRMPKVPKAMVIDPTPGEVPAGKISSNEPPAVGSASHHQVVLGDNLYQISRAYQVSIADLKQWNGLVDDDVKVGQVLRVAKPDKVVSPIAGAKPSSGGNKAKKDPADEPQETKKYDPNTEPSKLSWVWPSQGSLIRPFSAASKGIDIGGTKGQPVIAVADGKVMYSGQGLKGYGKLIIIKHDKTYLSAYAHNHQLLVSEGQTVKQGQKIAEMGSSEAEQVKLHFEIRRYGKPVDPLSLIGSKASS
jgi:lipoprotein NlpD